MNSEDWLPRVGEWLVDNSVPLILAGIAFGGSFDHWVHLVDKSGQHGWLTVATAVCVDLGVYMAAKERQRDTRIGRKRKGLASWPTVVLIGGIILTLSGNLAGAQPTAWGITSALIPGAELLLSISLMERRAAEAGRRAVAAERQRLADEAADRQRQQRDAAERQRLADLDRQRQEAERQHAEAAERQRERQEQRRQAEAEAIRTAAESKGPGRVLALAPPPPAPDGSKSSTQLMREHWDTAIGAGQVPTGAQLMRAAGLDPASSSLGRQNAGKWRREPAAVAVAEVAAGAQDDDDHAAEAAGCPS